MFVKVHKAINTPAADNKGSCILLGDYLSKENEGKAVGDRLSFFNHKHDTVSQGSAVKAIDSNHNNLGKNDSKFFMLTINPSHQEIQHLIKISTGRNGVDDFNQLTRNEQERVFTRLRDYTRDVMDIYARNFNRMNVKGGEDLVYWAKIETMRSWHPWDKEVREGRQVKGTLKEGLQLHVHVVVSRNNVLQDTKLSPESRSRGGKQMLNGVPVQQGFNHEAFKMAATIKFKDKYNYQAAKKEIYSAKSGRMAVSNGDQLARDLKGQVSGKAISTFKHMLLQGQFSTELKIVKTVRSTISLLANPTSAVTNQLKEKLFSIIKGDAGAEL